MLKGFLLIYLLLVSTNVFSEVYYTNDKIYNEVRIENYKPDNYFGKIECGLYHCYGLKNDSLYVLGYNKQGQLGSDVDYNRDGFHWKKIEKFKVKEVSAKNFSGCLETKKGQFYQTGIPNYPIFDFEGSQKSNFSSKEWIKVSSCDK